MSARLRVGGIESPRRLRLRGGMVLLALCFAAVVAAGCGSDEGTRGLQPAHETATPDSQSEDSMTEAERREQRVREMESAEGVEP